MLSFLKGLLSSDAIVKGGLNALDSVWHTEEEKAENRLASDQLKLEFVKASAPMEVARRFIAVTVTLLWAVNGAMCIALYALDTWLTWKGIDHPDFGSVMEFSLWYITPPFTTITGFYFWSRMNSQKEKPGK
jgi:hypothetical protein